MKSSHEPSGWQRRPAAAGRRAGTALPLSQVHGAIPARKGGFTLIELMIVIGIAAIVMAVSVPFVHRALHKDPLSKAISELMEACHHARAHAILKGAPMELRILPQDGSFEVVSGGSTAFLSDAAVPAVPSPVSSSGVFSGRLPDDVFVEELAVNFLPLKDAEEVRVRFQPNGTSDEFTIVLQFEQQWRKISLDVVTALAEMEVIR